MSPHGICIYVSLYLRIRSCCFLQDRCAVRRHLTIRRTGRPVATQRTTPPPTLCSHVAPVFHTHASIGLLEAPVGCCNLYRLLLLLLTFTWV